ncbi:unnamed protein product [Angiostrongylus costaricensis]|uniref:Uncharacterized protein n=1 Tax=Angiostrongylus costaricensis TaxID=334426 RepID=A0A0R3Q206_ANGCS|nr:unnamed protein product [Angiostrongylus costaricensis]
MYGLAHWGRKSDAVGSFSNEFRLYFDVSAGTRESAERETIQQTFHTCGPWVLDRLQLQCTPELQLRRADHVICWLDRFCEEADLDI